MVIAFLRSDSQKVRQFAIEYARAHAPDIDVGLLVSLAEEGEEEVQKLAVSRLSDMRPGQIGSAAGSAR